MLLGDITSSHLKKLIIKEEWTNEEIMKKVIAG